MKDQERRRKRRRINVVPTIAELHETVGAELYCLTCGGDWLTVEGFLEHLPCEPGKNVRKRGEEGWLE